MRLSISNVILFFFIFATLELYFVSQITTSSTPNPLISSQGRKSMTTLGEPYQITNKVNGKGKRSRKQGSSMAKEYNAISNDDAEHAYNIDYHGVTTHPNPTPKHP